jgi:hypothetical protein
MPRLINIKEKRLSKWFIIISTFLVLLIINSIFTWVITGILYNGNGSINENANVFALSIIPTIIFLWVFLRNNNNK